MWPTMASNMSFNCSNTTLQSDHIPTQSSYSESEYILVFVFSLILVVGVWGNALVIYVFECRRKKQAASTTEWLILILGVIDILSTVFNSSLFIYWTITKHRRWDFGYLGCKVLPAIGPILITASSGVILIFAIDRYSAVVNPFRGQLSLKVALYAILADIVLSILSYTHYIYMIELKDGRCVSRPVNDLQYGIPNCTLIILRLLVFLTIFVYTSVRIFSNLRVNESTIRNRRMILIAAPRSCCSKGSGGACKKARSRRQKKVRQSNSIARVLFMIGTVFIILVFPREIFYLVYNLSWILGKEGIGFSKWILHLNSWLKVMHTANCCANVFIYAHMQSKFRKIVIKYFCCHIFRKKTKISLKRTTKNFSHDISMTMKTICKHEFSKIKEEVTRV